MEVVRPEFAEQNIGIPKGGDAGSTLGLTAGVRDEPNE